MVLDDEVLVDIREDDTLGIPGYLELQMLSWSVHEVDILVIFFVSLVFVAVDYVIFVRLLINKRLLIFEKFLHLLLLLEIGMFQEIELEDFYLVVAGYEAAEMARVLFIRTL